MSNIHGATIPLPDQEDDYRSRFVVTDEGRMIPKLAVNFYWMLRGHPEMRGVFVRDDSSVWLAARPPWVVIGEWAPHVAARSDYVQARMWLETQGLRPSLRDTIDAIDLIAK